MYLTTILKINIEKSLIFSSACQKSLDTSPLPKSLSLHCKQLNRAKNKVDGRASSLLACIQNSNYRVRFTPMHLVFLELDSHHLHLDFQLLNENSNVIITRKLHLQLLDKDYEHILYKREVKSIQI